MLEMQHGYEDTSRQRKERIMMTVYPDITYKPRGSFSTGALRFLKGARAHLARLLVRVATSLLACVWRRQLNGYVDRHPKKKEGNFTPRTPLSVPSLSLFAWSTFRLFERAFKSRCGWMCAKLMRTESDRSRGLPMRQKRVQPNFAFVSRNFLSKRAGLVSASYLAWKTWLLLLVQRVSHSEHVRA
jgi:hypothetical protein